MGGDQVPAVGLEHEAEWIQEPTAGRLLASGPTVVDGQAAARPHRARDLRQGSGVFGLGEPALVIDQEAFLGGFDSLDLRSVRGEHLQAGGLEVGV